MLYFVCCCFYFRFQVLFVVSFDHLLSQLISSPTFYFVFSSNCYNPGSRLRNIVLMVVSVNMNLVNAFSFAKPTYFNFTTYDVFPVSSVNLFRARAHFPTWLTRQNTFEQSQTTHLASASQSGLRCDLVWSFYSQVL